MLEAYHIIIISVTAVLAYRWSVFGRRYLVPSADSVDVLPITVVLELCVTNCMHQLLVTCCHPSLFTNHFNQVVFWQSRSKTEDPEQMRLREKAKAVSLRRSILIML